MRKAIVLLSVFAVAAAAVSVAAYGQTGTFRAKAAKVKIVDPLWYELVGQFLNSDPGVTPATHFHYGYLSWVQGVSAFAAAPRTEKNADFTFFADGKTSPIISNGPLRYATRIGTLTIYRDLSHNSDFTKPNTFRDGTRILIATYRHEPISSSLTGAISLFSHDQITLTRAFDTPHGKVQLGRVGETFDEHYVGQNNMPGPPSGYFIGYAVSR